MSQPRVARGIALSMICLLLLGVMPVISNSRAESVDALSFALALSIWQVVFAAPVAALELRGGARGIFGAAPSAALRRRMAAVALVTGAMFGLATYLYVLSVEQAGAATAAIALQAYPVFAILWESLFLRRRKTLLELALTAGLLAALFYLSTGGAMRLDGVSVWVLLALCVPFLWSIAHVAIKEELGRTPITPAQVTLFRVAISTAFLAVMLAIWGRDGAWGALLGVLAGPAAIAMGFVYYVELVVWFYAVRDVDVSLASSITTPWPALTLALAAAFLGDPIEGYQLGALFLVTLCVYGLTWAGLRRAATG